MVGKIFNEVSNPNIQTKILIDSVNTTLGLPEINKEISFDLEIKNEIKNEFKKEVGWFFLKVNTLSDFLLI